VSVTVPPMTSSESRSIKASAALWCKPLRWLLTGIRSLCLILLLGWGTLALYYNLPWEWLRLALAVVFLIFGIWALWYSRRPRACAVFAALALPRVP
jgi:hypothetical protein